MSGVPVDGIRWLLRFGGTAVLALLLAGVVQLWRGEPPGDARALADLPWGLLSLEPTALLTAGLTVILLLPLLVTAVLAIHFWGGGERPLALAAGGTILVTLAGILLAAR